MEIADLEWLKLKATDFLLRKFPSGSFLVKLSRPESPNPVIYFEVEAGGDFAQGRFWANNEYNFGILLAESAEVVEKSGEIEGREQGISLFEEFLLKEFKNYK